MLTADLAQSWQREGRVRPLYIPPDDHVYLRDAAQLINLFTEHEGRARRSLNEDCAAPFYRLSTALWT